MRLATTQRNFSSPFGGSEQTIDLLNDRWLVSLTLPPGASETQASIEAFVNAMRGMTNTCDLWHMQRRQPCGTMRGTPTVTYATGKGASYMIVSGTPGQTLLAGDMIGIGGLLLCVAINTGVDGTGVMGVTLANRLRKDIPAGTAVIWDKPTAPFRMMSAPAVQYRPGYAEGVSLDFAEVIA